MNPSKNFYTMMKWVDAHFNLSQNLAKDCVVLSTGALIRISNWNYVFLFFILFYPS